MKIERTELVIYGECLLYKGVMHAETDATTGHIKNDSEGLYIVWSIGGIYFLEFNKEGYIKLKAKLTSVK